MVLIGDVLSGLPQCDLRGRLVDEGLPKDVPHCLPNVGLQAVVFEGLSIVLVDRSLGDELMQGF